MQVEAGFLSLGNRSPSRELGAKEKGTEGMQSLCKEVNTQPKDNKTHFKEPSAVCPSLLLLRVHAASIVKSKPALHGSKPLF